MKININWSDLGSYSALYEKSEKDTNGNVCNLKKQKLSNCKNNIILLPKEKKIILEGINNYIIVEKDNVILIYPKEKDQEIKNLNI
jgi:mannose-1-phosphate guanylyltransferase